jgi:hypothetical protein
MKMNMLRLRGAQTVDLPLLGADPSGPFVLKGAEGLGPPEVTVRMSRTVLEKALYQGKSVALRQIVALVGLQPDWDVGQTAEELRTVLYSLLTPRYGQMIKAEIVNDGVVQAFAQGQISKMEAALFTKDPAVQITLDCDYGYLLKPTTIVQEPPQRQIGVIVDDPGTPENEANPGLRAFDIENDGTAPSGFKMGVILRANVGTSLILADENPQGQKFQVDGINWIAGDRFVIDTRPGTRGVWRGAAGGNLVSVLNNMNAGVSEWLSLYEGDNTLTLNTTAFDWDPEFQFRHQPAYWGV